MIDQKYTHEQVRSASLDYFEGDEPAADTFVRKYALQNAGVWYELTPNDMHARLAREFSRIEKNYPNGLSYEEILEALSSWKVVPQGSPMSGIGNPFQIQSLSNCFVIDSPHDSYAGIMRTDEYMVQLMKRRGGVGVDVSTIRPKGMPTTNAALTTDGIGVFMHRYSNSTSEVAQGGRRGALMMALSCLHPQLDTFIDIKRDKTVVQGANISIKWFDRFMEAVESDSEITLQWPVDVPVESAKVTKSVKAREYFDRFVQANWEAAEPGAFFWDTVIRKSIPDVYAKFGFKTVCTNPCGEIPLSFGDSCRLLVVNLTKFVKDKWTPQAKFDFKEFGKYARIAQRLLDDLIDLELEAVDKIIDKIESDPEPEEVKSRELNLWKDVRRVCAMGRRTGCGVTGLGDAIAMCGMTYGDEASIELTSAVYRQLAVSSWTESCTMAGERGPFPIFDRELECGHEYLEHILSQDEELRRLYDLNGRRNIANTTTAPVGSTSMLTRTTSGIEPTVFAIAKRKVKLMSGDSNLSVDFVDELGVKWHEYTIVHPGLRDWAKTTGNSVDDVQKSPYWHATCEDIDWLASVKLQAAAQKFVDHSISKTVNFPASATQEQIREAYITAWKLGCKGLTVYRQGTRRGVYVDATQTIDEAQPKSFVESHAPKRPKLLPCDIHQVKVSGEAWTILVGLLDGKPYEIFGGLSKYVEIPKKRKKGMLIKNGKKEGITQYNLSVSLGSDDEDKLLFKDVVNLFENPRHGAWTRLMSLSLRHGIPLSYIVEQLQKDKHSDMLSFSRVIARVLKGYIPDGTVACDVCPDCGGKLTYIESCVHCVQCPFGLCG